MLAFGAAIGGVVGAVFGASVALLIDSLTFIVAGLLIMSIKTQKFKAAPLQHTRPKIDTSFREGLRFLRRNRATAATLLVKFGASLGNIDTLMTIFATQIFVLGSERSAFAWHYVQRFRRRRNRRTAAAQPLQRWLGERHAPPDHRRLYLDNLRLDRAGQRLVAGDCLYRR